MLSLALQDSLPQQEERSRPPRRVLADREDLRHTHVLEASLGHSAKCS